MKFKNTHFNRNGEIEIHSMDFHGPRGPIAATVHVPMSQTDGEWKATNENIQQAERTARLFSYSPMLLEACEAALAAFDSLSANGQACPEGVRNVLHHAITLAKPLPVEVS